MSDVVRTAIEDDVIRLLGPLRARGGNGGYLAACEPYFGELEGLRAEEVDRIRDALAGRLPGILVMVSDSQYRDGTLTRRRWVELLTIELILASGNLRSKGARARGGVAVPGADPGLHIIVQDARNILVGAQIEVDGCGRIRPLDDAVVIHAPDLALRRLRLQVEADVRVLDDSERGGDLLTLRGRDSVAGADDEIGVEGNPALVHDADLTEDEDP